MDPKHTLLAVPLRLDVHRELLEVARATEGWDGHLGAFVAEVVRVWVGQYTGRNLPSDAPVAAPAKVAEAKPPVLNPNPALAVEGRRVLDLDDGPAATPVVTPVRQSGLPPQLRIERAANGEPSYFCDGDAVLSVEQVSEDVRAFHVIRLSPDFALVYTADGRERVATLERASDGASWIWTGGAGLGPLWTQASVAIEEWCARNPKPAPPADDTDDGLLDGDATGPVALPDGLVWAMRVDALVEALLPSAKAYRGQRLTVGNGPAEMTAGDVLLLGHADGFVSMQVVRDDLALGGLAGPWAAKGWAAKAATAVAVALED